MFVPRLRVWILLALALPACHSSAPSGPPSLSNLQVPATIAFGQTGAVKLDYKVPSGAPASLEVTRHNALGDKSASIPAAALGISGSSGEISFTMDARVLAAGANDFGVTLVDKDQRRSATLSFTVGVVGAAKGGSAPSVTSFAARHPAWQKPSGAGDRLRPTFDLSYADADGDIERARVRITRPSGQSVEEVQAAPLGISGAAGAVVLRPLSLSATDAAGRYTVEITLIDRNGNEGVAATQAIDLGSSGEAILAISGFSPATGAPGELVTLTGAGFGDDTRVRLEGSPVVVQAVSSPGSMTVVVPAGAGTGKFIAEDSNGTAVSSDSFHIPESVQLTPASAQIAVLQTLRFDAQVLSTRSSGVVFSVNGIAGGNSTVGTVAADGTYTAPADVPPGGVVTLRAAVSGQLEVKGEAQITVLPPPPRPGSSRILPGAGGVARSDDGAAELLVPPGAVGGAKDVTVSFLRGSAMPRPLAGRRLIAACDLGPSGTQFAQPATLTLRLVRSYPPGTQLRALYFDPASGVFQPDPGIAATVLETGDRASAQITHFSGVAFDDGAPGFGVDPGSASCSLPPVSISALEPSSAQEGQKLPVRIRGAGLTPDLSVRVLLGGAETGDVRAGSLYGLGTVAGVMLQIMPIPNLPKGQSRDYTVRVERPGGCVFAEAGFTVQGLDELVVPAGQTATLDTSGSQTLARYSAVTIAGNVLVPPQGALALESTGPVRIDGQILANGDRGADAQGSTGGAGGLEGGRGGRGDGSDDERAGGNANVVRVDSHIAQGLGGRHGVDVNLGGVLDLVGDAFSCVVGDVEGCVEVVGDVAVIVDTARDFSERGGEGEGGYGGVSNHGFAEANAGGGGGGGGGQYKLDVLITLAAITGGGGGAGGEAGRGVLIRGGDTLTLGDSALVITRGGDGGDGSTEAHLEILGINVGNVHTGSGGGGGGGGNGGGLTLGAANLVSIPSPTTQVVGGGGNGGKGGIQIVDVTTSTGVLSNQHFVFKTGFGQPGKGGGTTLQTGFLVYRGPSITEAFRPLDSMVTDRTAIVVQVPAPLFPGPTVTFSIFDENDVQHDFTATQDPRTGVYTADVVLTPGFNSFGSGDVVFGRRILVLAQDSDGDGLSDADELLLGSDPHNPDTLGLGVSDGIAFALGVDFNNPDRDEDGLSDAAEAILGTDRNLRDTDGDGVGDGIEAVLHTDPQASSSLPGSIPLGTWYQTQREASGVYLSMVDSATGTAGTVAKLNQGLGFSIAFNDSGVLYVGQGTKLATANPLTGAVTPVGPFTLSPGGEGVEVAALAFNPADKNLYGLLVDRSSGSPSARQLLRITPASGLATPVGSPAHQDILALAFNSSGAAFATIEGDATSSALASVSLASGTVASIGRIGFPLVLGLAFDGNDALHGNTLDGRLLDINPANGQGTLRSRTGMFVRGLTIKIPQRGSSGILRVTWTLSGQPATTGNCAAAGIATVDIWGDPSVPIGASGGHWVELSVRPCSDGTVDIPGALLVPGTEDVVLNFLAADGTFIGKSVLLFGLGPVGTTSIQFNFPVPVPNTAAVGLTWQIFEQNGFQDLARTCAQVGADTVRILAPSGGGTAGEPKPHVAAVFPCQDPVAGQGGTFQMPQGNFVGFHAQLEGPVLRLGALSTFFPTLGPGGAQKDLSFLHIGGFPDQLNPVGDGNIDVTWQVDDSSPSASCPLAGMIHLQAVTPTNSVGPLDRDFGLFDCAAGVAHLGPLPAMPTVMTGFLASDAPGPPVSLVWNGGEWTTNASVSEGQTIAAGPMRFFTSFAASGVLDLSWTVNGALPNQNNCGNLQMTFGEQPLAVLCSTGHAKVGGIGPATALLSAILLTGNGTLSASANATVAAGQTTTVVLDLVP